MKSLLVKLFEYDILHMRRNIYFVECSYEIKNGILCIVEDTLCYTILFYFLSITKYLVSVKYFEYRERNTEFHVSCKIL